MLTAERLREIWQLRVNLTEVYPQLVEVMTDLQKHIEEMEATLSCSTVSLEEIKQFLQDNPSMRAVLEPDFDAWTPRGHAAAEAVCILQLRKL